MKEIIDTRIRAHRQDRIDARLRQQLKGEAMKLLVLHCFLIGYLFLSPLISLAYPITTSERIPAQSLSSKYRDGYQAGGVGTVFTHYFQKQADGSWGTAQELRLNLAALKPLLVAGTVQLAGTNATTGSTEYYVGNGDNLAAHTTNYGWNYRYTRSFDKTKVEVDLEIAFDWSLTNLTDPEKKAKTSAWESNIETWWNNRYYILKDDQVRFGIAFDVTFGGYDDGQGGKTFDQTVIVKPGSGRADMTNWFLNDGAQTNSHEFGHMLGFFDEYWAGALDTSTLGPDGLPLTDYRYLMGANSGTLALGGGMKRDYYLPFMTWLDSIDPDASQVYALVPIPEPRTLFLLVVGLIGFVISKSARRRPGRIRHGDGGPRTERPPVASGP